MRPGRAHEVMRGAVDMHCHTHPALFPRPHDDTEVAQAARDLGMAAVVLKNHHMGTSARAYHAAKAVEGIEVIGSLVLNHYVGGLNPYAVESELKYGARVIWMPTVTSAHHLAYFGQPSFRGLDIEFLPVSGITILRDDGTLVPELKEILGLIAKADAVLATGHLSHAETRALVGAARGTGVAKIVVTHANFELNRVPVEMCRELVAAGAVIEYTFLPLTPLWHAHSPKELVEWIRVLGPEHVILSSDVGNYYNPIAPEALRLFVETLLAAGATPEEIVPMVQTNPRRLLSL